MAEISIIIPACNEAATIADTIQGVGEAFAASGHHVEIIVVDDGSEDATATIARDRGARVVVQPTNKGYGNALLAGVHQAAFPWIGIVDADGTYPLAMLPVMLEEAASRGLDMAVGARQGPHYDGNRVKRMARMALKWLGEWVVGEPIPDINSGLRVMRKDMILAFAPALSGGFSFTTSITIIAFQTAHHVAYIPIDYFPRNGRSHVRLNRDIKRALQIIVMTIVLFNPIKLYLLLAAAVGLWTLVATLIALLAPGLAVPLILATVGYCAGSVVLAHGFRAVREQVNLSGIALPRRHFRREMCNERTARESVLDEV